MEWLHDYNKALEVAQGQRKPILLQFEMDNCGGCKRLEKDTYKDEKLIAEMQEWFVLLKLDLIKDREIRKNFSAYWTPAFYFLNEFGKSHYFFNGYLPANEMRALIRLALSELLIPKGKYDAVIEIISKDINKLENTSFYPKLLVQRGLAEYIKTKDKEKFKGIIKSIIEKYPYSTEAKMYFWED